MFSPLRRKNLDRGSWQLAVGSWQLAVGSWQLAVGKKIQLKLIVKKICTSEDY
jgi:hypothetical protein